MTSPVQVEGHSPFSEGIVPGAIPQAGMLLAIF
jgi:hypothetical protein